MVGNWLLIQRFNKPIQLQPLFIFSDLGSPLSLQRRSLIFLIISLQFIEPILERLSEELRCDSLIFIVYIVSACSAGLLRHRCQANALITCEKLHRQAIHPLKLEKHRKRHSD